MSPDDHAWVGQMDRHATALKIAIDSNRKIPSQFRLASMLMIDAAINNIRCDVDPQLKPKAESA